MDGGGGHKKLDRLTITRQLLPNLMINIRRTRLRTSFSLRLTLSVCHSICLASRTGKTDAVFIEGLSPASQPADRKWPYIGFCLHSGCLISLPLYSPLLSPLCELFPQQQYFVSLGGRKRRYEFKTRRGGAGWEMRARAYESGTRKIKERKEGCCADRAQEGHQTLQALSGFSCSKTTLRKTRARSDSWLHSPGWLLGQSGRDE